MFYPLNVSQMIRAATNGARADDPTAPHTPSRWRRLAERMRRGSATPAPQRTARCKPSCVEI
jgi:hypothetical protein